MSEILATSEELSKIIERAVNRIGENHALARDNGGVTMNSSEIEEDRKEYRKEASVIEEALKDAATDMAEKMVLENNITNIVKEQVKAMGGGSGFVGNQGGSDALAKFTKRQEMGEIDEQPEKKGAVGDKPKEVEKCKCSDGKTYDVDCCKEEEMDEATTSGMAGAFVAPLGVDPRFKKKNVGKMEEQITKIPKKLKTIKVELEWPKLPLWFRKLFLKRYKTNKRFKGCTINGCNVWSTVSKSEKDKLKVELEKEEVTETKNVNENTVDVIKKLVKKKLNERNNTSIPGYDAFEKAYKESSKYNKEYEKEFKKKFEDYNDFTGNDDPKFPHAENSKLNADGQYQYYRNDETEDEFIEDWRGMGLEDAHGVGDIGRLSDYLDGSSETGNAQVDKDGTPLGNVVPNELGEKIKKKINRKKEKIEAQQKAMSNDKRYSPDVQNVKQVKEDFNVDIEQMKKLWSYNKKTQ